MKKRIRPLMSMMAIIIGVLVTIYYQFFNNSFFIDVLVLVGIGTVSLIIMEIIIRKKFNKT